MKKLTILSIIMLTAFLVRAQNKETRDVGTFTKISFRVPGKLYLRQGSPQKVVIEGRKDILEEIETDVEGSRLVIEKEGNDWNWGSDDRINVYITVKDIEGLNVGGSGDLIGETKIVTDDISLNVSGSGSMKVEVEASGDMESDVSGSGDIELDGKCKNFNSDVSGSGKVMMSLIASGNAEFGVSGSGKIEASGSASRVRTSISGSGKVLAGNLETNSCEVRITGSGDVEINVKNELDANITGSGSVRYKGNPSKVNSHSAGSGHVRKM
ncbi:MAG TPA: head GIN domain-containing protein [Chryseolinea sp.]